VTPGEVKASVMRGVVESARQRERARLDALIERTADWLMQGRDGDDSEGEAAARMYLDQLRRQRQALEDRG
jgi:hypothetical protein